MEPELKRVKLNDDDDEAWLAELDNYGRTTAEEPEEPTVVHSGIALKIKSGDPKLSSLQTFPFSSNYPFPSGRTLDSYLSDPEPPDSSKDAQTLKKREDDDTQVVPKEYWQPAPVFRATIGDLYMGLPWLQPANMNKYVRFDTARHYALYLHGNLAQLFGKSPQPGNTRIIYKIENTIGRDKKPKGSEYMARFDYMELKERRTAYLNDLTTMVMYMLHQPAIYDQAFKENEGALELFVKDAWMQGKTLAKDAPLPYGSVMDYLRGLPEKSTKVNSLEVIREFFQNLVELNDYETRVGLLMPDSLDLIHKTFEMRVRDIIYELMRLAGISVEFMDRYPQMSVSDVAMSTMLRESLGSVQRRIDDFLAQEASQQNKAALKQLNDDLKATVTANRDNISKLIVELRAWTREAITQQSRVYKLYKAASDENRALKKEIKDLKKKGPKAGETTPADKMKFTPEARNMLGVRITEYLNTKPLMRIVFAILGNRQSSDITSVLSANPHNMILDLILSEQEEYRKNEGISFEADPQWWKSVVINEAWIAKRRVSEIASYLNAESVAQLRRNVHIIFRPSYSSAFEHVMLYVEKLYNASRGQPITLYNLIMREAFHEICAYIAQIATAQQINQKQFASTRYDQVPTASALLNAKFAIRLKMEQLKFNFELCRDEDLV